MSDCYICAPDNPSASEEACADCEQKWIDDFELAWMMSWEGLKPDIS